MSAQPTSTNRPSDSRRGILWIVLSTILLALVNVTVKVLTEDYPVIEVAWARLTFNVLFLIVLFHRKLPTVMKSARPDFSVLQPAAIVPLVTATLLALYYISTRWISRVDGAMTTLVYTPLVGAGLFSVAVPFVWVTPDLDGWLLMAAIGLLGLGAHFALIKAFEAAPAATVTPFNYLGLVWATVLGFTVFSHLPDGWTLLGAAIIVAGGFYIFHREQRHG